MTTLAQYESARAALAEATRVDQVLPILDELAHVKLYARQIQDQELLIEATEFQLKAERRLGTIIIAAKEAGHFKEGRPKKTRNGSGQEPFSGVTLEEVGVDKKLSARAQKRASISEQAFDLMVAASRERVKSGRAKIVEAPLPGGARAIAPGRVEPDDSLDYFPTPPWATRALVEHVLRPQLGGERLRSVWEPACGEGHIAEVLREYFADVVASDIHDYGYGHVEDFLGPSLPDDARPAPADWIITNPPFGDKTEAFVLRALEWAPVGVAVFVRLQWLETIGRYEAIFRDQPPTRIAFFCERVNLCKGRWDPEGTTATAYIWLVWVKGAAPRAPLWIPPGRREQLTRADDIERFTAQPVTKRALVRVDDDHVDASTGEIVTAQPAPEDDGLDIPAFLRRGPAEATP